MHGSVSSALLRKPRPLEGKATFENVESKFRLKRIIRHGSVDAPNTLFMESGESSEEEKDGIHLDEHQE